MHSETQRRRFARLLCCAVLAAPLVIGQSQSSADDVQFFEKKVRPVLVNRCYACHSAATKPAGGLRVDDRNGLLNGGDSGPAVVPGDPEGSLLLCAHPARAIQSAACRRRAMSSPSSNSRILRSGSGTARLGPPRRFRHRYGRPRANYEALKASHWAFQPLKPVRPHPRDACAGLEPRSTVSSWRNWRSTSCAPVRDARASTRLMAPHIST